MTQKMYRIEIVEYSDIDDGVDFENWPCRTIYVQEIYKLNMKAIIKAVNGKEE
jgi:hypothetical protein